MLRFGCLCIAVVNQDRVCTRLTQLGVRGIAFRKETFPRGSMLPKLASIASDRMKELHVGL
jgi:hypothetical protein